MAPMRVVTSLVRIVAATSTRLAAPGSPAVAYNAPSSALLCLTATTAVAALCGFLEAELRAEGRPLRLASLSDVPLPLAATPLEPRACMPGTAAGEALEAGAVMVLVSLVSALRRARLGGVVCSVGNVPLEAPALRCLAALLVSAPATGGAYLRESGGLEALLESVGQAPATAQSSARSELCAQLAALEVCAAAVSADRESLRRAANVGMFARLGALLRWVGAEYAPELGAVPLPRPSGQLAPSPSLELVFVVLRVMCAGVAEEVGARRALAERTLVTTASVALAAAPVPPRWPALAEHALFFLESLVRAGPLAVAALRGAGAEEALFGAGVFFWSPRSDGDQPCTDAGAAEAARNTLRLRATSLLHAIAAAPAWSCGGVRVDLGCEPEVAALMRALDAAHAASDAGGCRALVCVLNDLALAAPERFGAAAVALAVPVALAGVMACQQAPTVAAGDDAEAVARARTAVRAAFAAVLACGDSVRCSAAGTPLVPDALLSLAWDPPDVDTGRWALQHLRVLAGQRPLQSRASGRPAGGAALASGKTALLRALLNALRRAQREQPRLILPLLATLRVSAAVGPGEQIELAALGAHDVIMQLLQGAGADAERGIVHALGTLATLLAGCAAARDAFAVAPGYVALSAELERNAALLPTPALLLQLRCLACDIPGVLHDSDELDSGVEPDWSMHSLRHAGTLPVLLSCLKRASPDERLGGIRWLTATLRASAAAQCCAAEAALPRALLEWYGAVSIDDGDAERQKEARLLRATLAGALCTCHAMSAEDIRAAFVLLRQRAAPGRGVLLNALCGAAAAARDEPRAFFAMPGGGTHAETGLHLTLPLRWPSGRAMTFFMWLRADSLPATAVTLLCLRAESGAGVLLTVDAGGADIAVYAPGTDAGPPASEARMAFVIKPRRWQSIALVLGAGGLGPLGGGERARVFIDGAELATARLRLPRGLAASPLTCCAVGAAPVPDGWSPVPPCFAGQVASPHLFEEALRPSTIAALHAGGPDLVLEAQAQAAPSPGTGEAQDAANRCVMALSAAASATAPAAGQPGGSSRTVCYNIAPVQLPGAVGSALSCAAVAGASTAVCVFRGVREAVRALGGVAALLPLLEDTDSEVVAAALLLAAEVVDLADADYALLAHALRRRGARTPISRAVFEAAVHLVSTAALSNVAAVGAVLTYDVSLWAACASYDARLAQASLLAAAAKTSPAEVRSAAAPARTCDAVLGLDAACESSAHVRSALLAAVTAQTCTPASADHVAADTAPLAALVVDTLDPQCAADAALTLAGLLAPSAPRREAYATAVAALGGPAIALHVVHCAWPSAQPAAVRLLAVLLCGAGVQPGAAARLNAPGILAALRAAIASQNLTADLCDALLGLACGTFTPAAADGGKVDVALSAASARLVHPAALGIVLQLVKSCPDRVLRVSALNAIVELVEHSVANAAAFVRHRGWQAWVLQLLYADGCSWSGELGKKPDTQELPGECRLARRLLAALHAHCMLRFGGPGGGEELERTASYAALHSSSADSAAVAEATHAVCYGVMPQRVLCHALMDALQLALLPGTRWGPSVTHNVSAALFLVDELLPVTGSLIPLSPAQRAQHEAQPVAECIWQLCSAAAQTLANLWPSLQAAVSAAANAVAVAADAVAAPSLRQRALSLLLWTGGGAATDAAELANAVCAQAARLTLRLCLLYVRDASVDDAAVIIDVLMPFLAAACADGDRCQLFCSAVAETHRAAAAAAAATTTPAPDALRRAELARTLLLAAAVAGSYLPSPADAPSCRRADGSACGVEESAGQALTQVLQDALSQARVAAASEAEAAAMRTVVARRLAAVAALREELTATAAAESVTGQAIAETTCAAVAKLVASERARRAAANAVMEEEAVTQERRLRHALRGVSGERGVWAPVAVPQAHWKMDKTEDSKRRRQRLRRCYRHTPYTDASHAQQPSAALSDQQLAAAAKLAVKVGAVRAVGGEDDPDAADVQEADALLAADHQADRDADAVDAAPEDVDDDQAMPPHAFVERDAAAAAAAAASSAGVDELLWTIPATLVTVKRTVTGRLDIHRKHVHFEANVDAAAAAAAGDVSGEPAAGARRRRRDTRWHWRWPCARLTAVHCQRYLLQSRALELFLDDRSSAFLALPTRADAIRAAAALVRARPGLPLLDRRRKVEAAARAAERWRRREMSNFEYLMTLNTLAGRSYNDLAQYPVLPWVIADYASEQLDLGAPGALRDLTRPVGALNPSRRAGLAERYAMLAAEGDADIPPFHHGSHYSTPGGVLHWLLRLQPFTALHRGLQGGRFDHGDRLFHSLPAAWAGAWANAADVRELTPEFFCMPEFLLNGEGHDLGVRQDGRRVGDVALPPWARGNAAAFVRANAAALECEAVSARLDGWIDLIFGVAQRGPAAVEALNVFYHLTYEGAVDLERCSADAHAATALADQIALFGQTPAQLFTRKHPSRDAPLWPPAPLCAAVLGAPAPRTLVPLADAAACAAAAAAGPAPPGGAAVVFLCLMPGAPDARVLAVCADGSIGVHRLLRPAPAAGAFTFSAAAETGYALGTDASFAAAGAQGGAGGGGGSGARGSGLPPFAASVAVSPACFATLAGGRLLLSAAHWDARLRVLRITPADGVYPLQALGAHADLVTCAAAAAGVCVTGSRDTTVCVWELATTRVAAAPLAIVGTADPAAAAAADAAAAGCASPLRPSPRCVLSGHDAPVSCVACSEELDLVVSASAGDASVMFHALRSGRYLRSLRLPPGVAPASMLLSDAAGVVVLLLQPPAPAPSQLRAFNCNGLPLGTASPAERLGTMTLTADGHALLTGGERGVVVLRDAASLEERGRWVGARAPVTALCAAADDAFLAGTQDGRLLLWGAEAAPALGAASPSMRKPVSGA
jgi:hypothetical protein